MTLETTRPDYLSSYGSTNHTPALDAIAAAGARFEFALSASAVSSVSHATILTGCFPYEHGLRVLSAGSGYRLPGDQPTLATALHEAGYLTAAVLSAFPVSAYFGFERGFESFDSLDGSLDVEPGVSTPSVDLARLQRRSDETTDRALAVLDQAQADDRPLFLWVHYWDPHDPVVQPPPEYLPGVQVREESFSPSDAAYGEVYAAEVRFLDHEFDRLVEGLRERGMLDHTLLAVVADHGQGLADGFARHGWGLHRMDYQEQLHVPLLLSGPGVPAGRVLPDVVRTADVAPTLGELAGVPVPSASGRSLVPLLDGRTMAPATAYAEQLNAYDHLASMVAKRPDAAFLYTVCDGRWKLIYRPHMPERSELFDLSTDPGETQNLLGEEREVYLHLMDDLAARDPWVLEPFAPRDQGDVTRELTWTWICPAHPGRRREERGRCGVEACSRRLVPTCDW